MSTFTKRMEQALRTSQNVSTRRVKLGEGTDFTCALLGSLGFSSRYISEHTAFSTGQISYRLRLGGIKRSDYRNGSSTVATSVLTKVREVAEAEVTAHLTRVLAAQSSGH